MPMCNWWLPPQAHLQQHACKVARPLLARLDPCRAEKQEWWRTSVSGHPPILPSHWAAILMTLLKFLECTRQVDTAMSLHASAWLTVPDLVGLRRFISQAAHLQGKREIQYMQGQGNGKGSAG